MNKSASGLGWLEGRPEGEDSGGGGVSLIREEQGGLSQVEKTKTSAELNLMCGSKSPSWPLLGLALETINAPPGFHPGTFSLSIPM